MPTYAVTYRTSDAAAPSTISIAADHWKFGDKGDLFLVRRAEDGSNQTVAGFKHPISIWDSAAPVTSPETGRMRVIGGA